MTERQARAIYGQGEKAIRAEEEDAVKKARRVVEQKQVAELHLKIDPLNQAMEELIDASNTLLSATLEIAGFRFHRGQWRKRRYANKSS